MIAQNMQSDKQNIIKNNEKTKAPISGSQCPDCIDTVPRSTVIVSRAAAKSQRRKRCQERPLLTTESGTV